VRTECVRPIAVQTCGPVIARDVRNNSRSAGPATAVIFIAANVVLDGPEGKAHGRRDVGTGVVLRAASIIEIGNECEKPENKSHNEAWGITVPQQIAHRAVYPLRRAWSAMVPTKASVEMRRMRMICDVRSAASQDNLFDSDSKDEATGKVFVFGAELGGRP
jgi:hypothetical protein